MRSLSLAAALLALVAVLRWFRARDNRLFAYYLMHDYAHSAQAGGAYPPDLEDRLADFADRIAAALADDVDEVLVVGHSSGAHLAVSMLADLLRAGRVPPGGPALATADPGAGGADALLPARGAPAARRPAIPLDAATR